MTPTLIDAIIGAGYAAPHELIWDGELHRFASDAAKKTSKDAWYIAHDDAKGKAAAFGSWRDNRRFTWSNGAGRVFTPSEVAEIKHKVDASRAEIAKGKEETAARAARIYNDAKPSGHSDYLQRKKIKVPSGVRFVSNLDSSIFGFSTPWKITGAIAPMQTADGKIVNLQIMDGTKKLFMPRSITSGAYHILGIDGAMWDRIVIAEGVATAQSILDACGLPVFIAFSSGNIPAVCRIVRTKYPNAEIILAADGDPAGRSKCEEAKNSCTGKISIISAPDGKDFNDVPFMIPSESVSCADLKKSLICKIEEDGSLGKILPRLHNYIEIFSYSDDYAGRIVFDDFAKRPLFDGEPMDDGHYGTLRAGLEKSWIADRVGAEDVAAGVLGAALRRKIHPLQDYLNGLRWDGVERIDSFFPDHCGSPADDYHIGVSRALFAGLVNRAMNPGCQMDLMVVLESAQGKGKSAFWIALGGQYYIDQTNSMDSKDFQISIKSKWIVDLGELDQMQKTEITRVKQLITIRSDTYRPLYAKESQDVLRHNIFVGGTNSDKWIRDQTGGRRFLPVKVLGQIDISKLAAVRDQLFAEAMHYLRTDSWGKWWEVPDATAHQEERTEIDPWEEDVADWLLPRKAEWVTTAQMFDVVIKKPLEKITQHDRNRLVSILRKLGWESGTHRVSNSRVVRGFFFPPPK